VKLSAGLEATALRQAGMPAATDASTPVRSGVQRRRSAVV